MTLTQTMTEILETTKMSKYALAQQLGIQPIMIDHILSGRSKGVNRAIADNILVTYYIKIDDQYINNMEPRASHEAYLKQTKMEF